MWLLIFEFDLIQTKLHQNSWLNSKIVCFLHWTSLYIIKSACKLSLKIFTNKNIGIMAFPGDNIAPLPFVISNKQTRGCFKDFKVIFMLKHNLNLMI